MIAIRCFIFLLILAFATSNARKKRIINGTEANIMDAPYQVSIQYNSDSAHICGGVIIHENYVLTAGVCLYKKRASELQIISGSLDIIFPEDIRHVDWILLHPEFKKDSYFHNDIGIIKVARPFEFHGSTFLAVLPSEDLVIPPGTKLLATGWGSFVGPNTKLSQYLQKVEVTVIDQKLCKRRYSNYARIYPSQICTHDIGPKGKGVCRGDSGGPLIMKDGVIAGIISWSRKDPNCASPLYPDIHTKVSAYVDWINSIIYAM